MKLYKRDIWVIALWAVAVYVLCTVHVKQKPMTVGRTVTEITSTEALASTPCSSNWCFSVNIGSWDMYGISQGGFWDATTYNYHGDYGFNFVVWPTIKCGWTCSGLPDSHYTKISYDDPACAYQAGSVGTLWFESNGTWYACYCLLGTGHHHAQWQFGSNGCPPPSQDCGYILLPYACTISEGPCTGN